MLLVNVTCDVAPHICIYFVVNMFHFFQVVTLSGKGHDLTVDWISHTLYIVESASLGRSSITQFNIETKEYKVLLSRPAYINNILVDPFNR